tara:strand:- start:414 stop:1931 length:1518 start_codon:yes stop_codon:yes gene_type:complete
MAGLKDGDDFKDGESFKASGLLKFVFAVLGFGGLLLFFILRFAMPEKAPEMGYSWLFAVIFFLSLAVGGLFWTLLHHASNSGWGTVVRRLMENLGSLIPFILILAIPLLFQTPFGFRDALWEWFPLREAALVAASDAAVEGKDAYVVSQQKALAEAEKEVKAARSELEGIGSPSPGHKAYFDKKIGELEEKAAVIGAEDLSEGAVLQKLADEDFREHEGLLFVKRGYLNNGFWWFRNIFYFVVLSGIALTLRKMSLIQDGDSNPKWFRWMRRSSCGFLPFFATAWTFLVFDWLMALDYTWFSTMWGVYLFAGAALNSMGFLVILLTLIRRAGYLRNVVTLEHYHLMGKLMLAFVIFWAYIAFSQFFLIWYANITEETKFYLTRNTEFWNTYTITLLVIGHFFVPFGILLFQSVKKVPIILSLVALWNLAMHVFDIYWIIIPERGPSLTAASGDIAMTIPGAWIFDVLAFVSVGGIFGYFLIRQLSSASLFPCRDPRLDESLNVVN